MFYKVENCGYPIKNSKINNKLVSILRLGIKSKTSGSATTKHYLYNNGT